MTRFVDDIGRLDGVGWHQRGGRTSDPLFEHCECRRAERCSQCTAPAGRTIVELPVDVENVQHHRARRAPVSTRLSLSGLDLLDVPRVASAGDRSDREEYDAA